MIKHRLSSAIKSPFRHALLASATAAAFMAAVPQPAQALTLLLNFTAVTVTENAGAGTSTIGVADFSTWGFTGMNLAAIQSSVLAAVNKDYLMYPTTGADPLSTLPDGKELDINFEIVSSTSSAPGTWPTPANGDTSYYHFGIGNTSGGGETELGHACLGCVIGAFPAATNGTMVGVNFTNNLQGLTVLASTNTERINILAGTVSHEVGHALSLLHPLSSLPNPGASSFSIMATGASPTSMPNGERLKDRAFAYSEFATLIGAVGVRDVTPVPEPATYAMLLLGLGVVAAARKRQAAKT